MYFIKNLFIFLFGSFIYPKLYPCKICKEQIESKFGHELDWQRLDEGKGSRVAFYLNDVSVFNEEDWYKMIEFMTGNMIKFEKAMKVFCLKH